MFNFYGVGKKLFEGLLSAFGEPYGGEHSDTTFAAAVVDEHGQVFFVCHYGEKLLLHIGVGEIGRIVRVSIQRHLEILNAVASDPGNFFAVPVLLAVFGGRAEIDDCGDMVFVEQPRIVHTFWLSACVKQGGLDGVEVFNAETLDEDDGRGD